MILRSSDPVLLQLRDVIPLEDTHLLGAESQGSRGIWVLMLRWRLSERAGWADLPCFHQEMVAAFSTVDRVRTLPAWRYGQPR